MTGSGEVTGRSRPRLDPEKHGPADPPKLGFLSCFN